MSFAVERIVAGGSPPLAVQVCASPTVPLPAAAIIVVGIHQVIVLQVLQDAAGQTLTVGGALIRVGEFRKGHRSFAVEGIVAGRGVSSQTMPPRPSRMPVPPGSQGSPDPGRSPGDQDPGDPDRNRRGPVPVPLPVRSVPLPGPEGQGGKRGGSSGSFDLRSV